MGMNTIARIIEIKSRDSINCSQLWHFKQIDHGENRTAKLDIHKQKILEKKISLLFGLTIKII